MTNEIILGFDAREMWLDIDKQWTAERRSIYLLRPDVPRPLSTDVMVWESIFLVRPMQIVPKWIGPNQELWDELPRMIEVLPAYATDASKPFWTIAVTLVMDLVTGANQSQWEGIEDYGIIPTTIDPSWKLLGYDVSDRFQLSGLTNCGAVTDEQRVEWSDKLNVFHLFQNADDAAQFGLTCDTNVPAHAPFFVFGIYLMEQYPQVEALSPIEIWRALDEALEPAREAFRAEHLDMTEDEAMDFFNEIIHEVRRERLNKDPSENKNADP